MFFRCTIGRPRTPLTCHAMIDTLCPPQEVRDPGVCSESIRSDLYASRRCAHLAQTSAAWRRAVRSRRGDDDVGRKCRPASRRRGRRFIPSAHTDGPRPDPPEQRDLLPGLHDVQPLRGGLRAVRVLPLGHRHRLQEQPAAHEGREVARDAADHCALHHSGRRLPARRPEQVRRDRRGGVAERDRGHRRAGGVAERPHPDDPPGHGLHRGRRPEGRYLRPGRLHCQ